MNYVPILTTKASEFEALQGLSDDEIGRVDPLFICLPETQHDDPSNEYHAITGRLEEFYQRTMRPVRIDVITRSLPEHRPWLWDGAEDRLQWLVDELNAVGVPFVPTLSLARTVDYWAIIRSVVDQSPDRGYVLRVSARDSSAETIDRIRQAMTSMATGPEHVDLLIDEGHVNLEYLRLVQRNAEWFIPEVAKLGPFRSMTYAGTSAPDTWSEIVKPGETKVVSRAFRQMFDSMMESLPHTLQFGDYGISGASVADINPAHYGRTMCGRLVYAMPGRWHVARRGPVSKTGYAPMLPAAREILEGLPRNPISSSADRELQEQFDKEDKGEPTSPGNAQVWLRRGYNRHFAVVLREEATPPGSSE